jgi:hypothetical protein
VSLSYKQIQSVLSLPGAKKFEHHCQGSSRAMDWAAFDDDDHTTL